MAAISGSQRFRDLAAHTIKYQPIGFGALQIRCAALAKIDELAGREGIISGNGAGGRTTRLALDAPGPGFSGRNRNFYGTKRFRRRLRAGTEGPRPGHVRGFAGRFLGSWPRASGSAVFACFDASSRFRQSKPLSACACGVSRVAQSRPFRPSSRLFISANMHGRHRAAAMRRACQSPAFGVLYADR